MNELTGRTLKRPLGAGAALMADAFAHDMVIKRGQQVTLLAAPGGVEVRVAGRALADASRPAASVYRIWRRSENANVICVTP